MEHPTCTCITGSLNSSNASDLSWGKRGKCTHSRGKKRVIAGTKWEYPIPKAKSFWEKFCNDAEEKLIKVRDPVSKLRYNPSYPAVSNFQKCCKSSNYDSCVDSHKNARTSSKNSMHKISPVKSNFSLNKNHSAGIKPFPDSILKIESRRSCEGIDSTRHFNAATKVTRNPKLNVASSQPSFGKIISDEINYLLPVFSDLETRLPAKKESTVNDSPIIPSSIELFGAPLTQSTSKNLMEDFSAESSISKDLEAKNSSKNNIKNRTINSKTTRKDNLPSIKSSVAWKNDINTKLPQLNLAESSPGDKSATGKEAEKQSSKTRQSLKYSVRRAYKALKFLTPNKKLDFEPKVVEQYSEKSLPGSSNSSSASIEEELDSLADYNGRVEPEDQEFLFFREAQKELRGKWIKNLRSTSAEYEHSVFKSEEARSKTIPSESRSTSGSSPEFILCPELWESPSTRILSAIPKLSGFPRKNCDRCLPCLHKAYGATLERKVSLPRSVLRRTIMAPENYFLFTASQDSDTDSESLVHIEDDLERISVGELEAKDVRFQQDFQTLKSQSSLPPKVEQEEIVIRQDVDSGASSKAISIFNKIEQGTDDPKLLLKNVEASKPSSVSVATTSLERSKVSSSPEGRTSVEDGSLDITMSDDQAKSKYLAPCHTPTIWCPSLEPLRALKLKKPTSLQARIDMNERTSIKNEDSSEECYEDIEEKVKPKSTMAKTTREKALEKQKLPPAKSLTKAKSMLGRLTLDNAECDIKKEEHVLRKRSSFTSIETLEPKNIEAGTSKIFHVESKDILRKLDSSPDNVSPKQSAMTDSSELARKIPFSRTNEIREYLDRFGNNVSAANMLNILCKEFSSRVSKDFDKSDRNLRKNNKIISRLVKLLVDSKLYLYPDKFPSDLVFSTNQPILCNPFQLQRILPHKSYNIVAPLLGLPSWEEMEDISNKKQDMKKMEKRKRLRTGVTFDLEVQPPTIRESTTEGDEKEIGPIKYSPYALFMRKPRRKIVTWRPLTERDLKGYDPDRTLNMRANNMMRLICQDFCQWIENLGGTLNVIDEEVLRDMFEIDLKAEACRAMQISIKEMPIVPTEVALTRNTPLADKLAMTKKLLIKDAKAEQKAPKIKAFGTTIPLKFQVVPPNNQVRKRWLQCENVPRDLETMRTVWQNITHLESVRGFVEWLQKHPEIPPPSALKTIVRMDISGLRRREFDESIAHLEYLN